MSNRITSGIKRSNDPEEVWNSSQVNNDLDKLDAATNNLPNELLSTNTEQTVNGQKFFFNFFVDNDDSVVTYEEQMDNLPFDISPVFGPGTYHFGKDQAIEEGRYYKHNPSGTKLDIAALNPVFMPSEIDIEVVDDTSIRVKALNVPMPVTSLGGSYSASDTNMTAYNWKTSISLETTYNPAFISVSVIKAHVLYLHYNPETDTAYIQDTVDDTTSTKILVRCIGAVFSKGSKLLRTKQHGGVIYFSDEMLFNDLRPLTNYFGARTPFGKILDTSILKLTVAPVSSHYISYSDGSEFPITFKTGQILESPDQFPVYIPVHRDGKYILRTEFTAWRVNEIIFGDLAL